MKHMLRWLGMAALAVMTASTAHAGPGKWGRNGGNGGGGLGFTRLAEMLNLSPQQRDVINKLRYDNQRAVIRLRAELQLARLDLRQLTEQHRPDLKQVEALIDKVGRLEIQLKKSRILMMLKMKAVLTPEQAAKVAELRKQRRAGWGNRGQGWRRRMMWRQRMMQRRMGGDPDGAPRGPVPPPPPAGPDKSDPDHK